MQRIVLPESPEVTCQPCPYCGNTGTFIGIETRGTIQQAFKPPASVDDVADYDSDDHNIAGFRYVRCAECENLVWYDSDFFLNQKTVAALRSLGRGTSLERTIEDLISDRTLETLLSIWPVFTIRKGPEK